MTRLISDDNGLMVFFDNDVEKNMQYSCVKNGSVGHGATKERAIEAWKIANDNKLFSFTVRS